MNLQSFRQKACLFLIFITIFSFSLENLKPAIIVQTTDYEARNEAINQNIDRIKNEIEEVGSDLGHFGEEKQSLKAQITTLEEDIRSLDRLITETRVITSELETDIESQSKKIKNLEKKLITLLREMQTLKKHNSLTIILSSSNIGEAISKMQNLSRLQNEVDKISKSLNEDRLELQQKVAKQAETKDLLEESKALNKSKRDSLEYALQVTEGKESMYKDLLNTLSEQEEQLQAELFQNELALQEDRIRQERGITLQDSPLGPGCVRVEEKPVTVPKGYFASPAEGWLTQTFHCTHDAIDIANAMGTNIVASADGTVFLKSYMQGGYGNYIVLKHNLPSGDIMYSVYAHLTEQSFRREGEEVKQGEVIGYMGCTGNTRPRPCGVHLHFAIVSDTNDGIGYIGCLAFASRNCFDPLGKVIDIKLD